MPNDEAEFEKTLVDLSEDEQKVKRLEYKATKGEEYREKLNIQNRILEKEGFEFKDGRWEKKQAPAQRTEQAPAPISNLNPLDSVLIAKSDVDVEDVQEVIDFANYRKISISDALKNGTLKAILKDRTEERRSAAASQVKTAIRTSQRETPEQILEVAANGKLPDSDEGIQRLVEARITAKQNRSKR